MCWGEGGGYNIKSKLHKGQFWIKMETLRTLAELCEGTTWAGWKMKWSSWLGIPGGGSQFWAVITDARKWLTKINHFLQLASTWLISLFSILQTSYLDLPYWKEAAFPVAVSVQFHLISTTQHVIRKGNTMFRKLLDKSGNTSVHRYSITFPAKHNTVSV